MSLLLAHKNRKYTTDLTMTDSAGADVIPGPNDTVRVKIGRCGQLPILDLDNVIATVNGSIVTKGSGGSPANRVEIEREDMDLFQPGTYTLELSLVDNADNQQIKHVENQVFRVQSTMSGDVGLS